MDVGVVNHPLHAAIGTDEFTPLTIFHVVKMFTPHCLNFQTAVYIFTEILGQLEQSLVGIEDITVSPHPKIVVRVLGNMNTESIEINYSQRYIGSLDYTKEAGTGFGVESIMIRPSITPILIVNIDAEPEVKRPIHV